jgi:hypothetical protein
MEKAKGTNGVSAEVKKAIVENEMAVINQAIYTYVIRRRVADKVDDKAAAETCDKQLELLEKKLDAYKEELNAIQETK